MNEIVKYHNDMNTINFNKFNSTELDLLLSICAKIRDENVHTIAYSFTELRSLSSYKPTANSRFIHDLQQVNRKLLMLNFTIKTTNTITQFVLFKTFRIHLETQILEISVHEEFSYLLNELTANFTRFELGEFVSLESKYAKNLYRLLKQYRTTGRAYFSMEDFRDKLDIPASYKITHIDQKVLAPIKKELSPLFADFKIEKIKSKKRGNPVIQINFSFTPEKNIYSESIRTLERLKEVYLNDFTIDEVKTLSRYGSLEDLKIASKQYDDYKTYQNIDNKMGFMIYKIQETALHKNRKSLDEKDEFENLFEEI